MERGVPAIREEPDSGAKGEVVLGASQAPPVTRAARRQGLTGPWRRAKVAAVSVLELALDLPLDAQLLDRERELDDLLDEAWAIGDSYGVRVVGRLARGRHAGQTIIEEAMHRNTEIIVMGAARQRERLRRSIFGDTVDYVLKHAPCRVMVVTAKARAA